MVLKNPGKTVTVKILSCECQQIEKLSDRLTELTLRDIFTPITRNPLYVAAEQSGCHPSCGIPVAILKAAEAAMGMALPKDVTIRFNAIAEASCPAEHTHPTGNRNYGDQ